LGLPVRWNAKRTGGVKRRRGRPEMGFCTMGESKQRPDGRLPLLPYYGLMLRINRGVEQEADGKRS
jgi:hypothetical protein